MMIYCKLGGSMDSIFVGKLLGQDLGSSSLEELQQIDSQLERSLKNVRARKTQLFKEEIERLKAKEMLLLEENARLSQQRKEKKKGKKINEPGISFNSRVFFGLQFQR
ncbi:unnamed protein product [Coffea canephora]|uniref:K-box domain-containing protein n=1 Tax=Coffea canephora TaxID=49390 RepID=A0A068UPU9_COFCA|nr:unnamed protein product [Coffea canephora]